MAKSKQQIINELKDENSKLKTQLKAKEKQITILMEFVSRTRDVFVKFVKIALEGKA
jgi:hypothetical protein